MPRKRADTTIYLGEALVKKLSEYREQYPISPSTSFIVREAVARYLEEEEPGSLQTPGQWVRATQLLVEQLKERGVRVTTEAILAAIDEAEEERIRSALGTSS